MDLKVNRQSELPLHLQLKAQVKHLIRAGRLAPGQRMPTVRRLAPPGDGDHRGRPDPGQGGAGDAAGGRGAAAAGRAGRQWGPGQAGPGAAPAR
ncbi:MAG: GntR family transcriptional regulator [candidate division NC10 bacterium]|nr:GntR family transcriptional regulator [candidate division NC10 bacterium]